MKWDIVILVTHFAATVEDRLIVKFSRLVSFFSKKTTQA